MRHLLYGRDAEELRSMFFDWYLRPLAARLLAEFPDAQEVLLAAAQYPAHGVDDAVHHEVLVAFRSGLSWADVLDPDVNRGATLPHRLAVDHCRRALFGDAGSYLDDHQGLIAALGAYCKPGCTRESDPAEAFAPVAVVRRGRERGVEVEMVGTVVQPALLNVRDVGSRRVSGDAVEAAAEGGSGAAARREAVRRAADALEQARAGIPEMLAACRALVAAGEQAARQGPTAARDAVAAALADVNRLFGEDA